MSEPTSYHPAPPPTGYCVAGVAGAASARAAVGLAPSPDQVPVPTQSTTDVEQFEAEVAQDRRAEHRLLLLEALAVLVVVLVVVVRALWLT